MAIGKIVKQSTGYNAFVPNKFPTKEVLVFLQNWDQKQQMQKD